MQNFNTPIQYKLSLTHNIKRARFRSSFVSGLSSMLVIFNSNNFANASQKHSPCYKLRGDLVRLGGDMRRAIEKERNSGKLSN